jgi:methyltransferase
MPGPEVVSIVALVAVLVMMLGELLVSRANEHTLRKRGAVEPRGDVYRTLAWAYPTMFVAMAIEGSLAGRPAGVITGIGIVLFVIAKALKLWAMAALGSRWTYRVLVPPGAPLISRGPYAWLHHPNYVAVFGEIGGMAVAVGAPATGVLSLVAFAVLVKRRIAIEEKALGRFPGTYSRDLI